MITAGDNIDTWDGIEISLLRLIANSLNITLSIYDTTTNNKWNNILK